jgi:hypothetical protein
VVLGVVAGLVLTWPRVGPGGTVLLAPVLLLWPPIPAALAWANVNGWVFGLLAVAWRFPRAAGWAIGIAAALKLLPILAVAWLLGKRDWRNAAMAVAIPVLATLIVVAWDGFSVLSDFVVLQLNERPPEGHWSRASREPWACLLGRHWSGLGPDGCGLALCEPEPGDRRHAGEPALASSPLLDLDPCPSPWRMAALADLGTERQVTSAGDRRWMMSLAVAILGLDDDRDGSCES